MHTWIPWLCEWKSHLDMMAMAQFAPLLPGRWCTTSKLTVVSAFAWRYAIQSRYPAHLTRRGESLTGVLDGYAHDSCA
jgi:hypothetical protein